VSVQTFGAPFKGYVSSISRHLADPSAMTGDSVDCVMDPSSGAIMNRAGSVIAGDTYSGGEVSGLLEAEWNSTANLAARPRRLFPLRSESLTDGYETYACLYTRETQPSSGTFPTQDDGYFGTIYARNTNAGASLANYSLLSEFSSTHYPTSGGTYNSVHHIICVPLWYESGAGGYTRGAFQFVRRFLTPGSRAVIAANSHVYWGGLRGTPGKWNGRMNDATGSGSESVRVSPMGPYPNPAVPICGSPTAVAVGGNDAVWEDGDTFVVAVVGRRKDGSYTMPTIPRLPNTNLTSGLGLTVVGTPGGAAKYKSVTWAVPIFEDDVDARILCRSKKKKRSATTDVLDIDPGTLYICGVLKNNTQTQFTDTNGNDLGLLNDTNIVRLDHVQPRRSRYLGTGDQRALAGYTLPGQSAIIIAPMGTTTNWGIGSQGLNAPDTSAIIYGNQVMVVRITATALELNRYDVAGPTLYTASITLSGNTLQDVVDLINATSASGADEGQWRAQLAPGVDGTLDSTLLCPTTWDVTNCQGTSGQSTISTTTAGNFANVPLGYKITGSGSLPANTIVLRKDGDTIYLGTTAGAAATLTGNIAAGTTLTFSADCGDGTAYHATQRGYIRAFSPSYPFMAYLRRSALSGYDSPDRQSTYFTVSSPGAATSGVSLAPEAWTAGNRRMAPSSLGVHMGFVDIEGAAAVGFSKGLRMFINVRGVNTGEDFDYRLMTVEDAGGVVDDKSFTGGRGWAVYANDEGVFAIDKNRSPKCLSRAIHNYDTGQGDLLYELQQSRKAADSDTDTNHFHCAVLGSTLHIAYRASAAAGSYPNRRQVYHFSPGIEAAGLEELVNPETREPYGWSAPLTQRFSCMTQVTTSASGQIRLGTVESNAGTADGRIDRFDVSTLLTDNGVAYSALAYLATQMAGWFKKFSLGRIEAIFYSTSLDTPFFTVYRNRARTSGVTFTSSASSLDPQRAIFEMDMETRSNAESCEVMVRFGTDGAGQKLYGCAVESEDADSY